MERPQQLNNESLNDYIKRCIDWVKSLDAGEFGELMTGKAYINSAGYVAKTKKQAFTSGVVNAFNVLTIKDELVGFCKDLTTN